jgi:hypothetical protein
VAETTDRRPRRGFGGASWNVAGLAVALAACATTLPAPREPVTGALFRDLERQVTVAAAAGWGLDRLEVENLLEPALDSACRVSPLDRRALREYLTERIRRDGGPVATAWRARGKDLDAVDSLLVLTRMQLLLARVDEVADADCPFWLEPDPGFRGRQISADTWQVTGGGGGKAIVSRRGDSTDLMFGGAGRLLIGRTLADQRALYVGLEVGANASFPKDEQGERGKLEVGVDVVAPVVARFTAVNSYLELEAGWLGRATERDFAAIDHGVHVGAALGARALRTRFLFPGAVFGVSLERLFVDGADPMMIKVGARFSLDLDF